MTSMRHNVLQNITESEVPQFPYWLSPRLLWDVLRAHDSLAHVPDYYLGLETLDVESFGTRWRESTNFGHARVGYLHDVGMNFINESKQRTHLEAFSGNCGFILLASLPHLEVKKAIGVTRGVEIEIRAKSVRIIREY
jgi:hypothetical protein